MTTTSPTEQQALDLERAGKSFIEVQFPVKGKLSAGELQGAESQRRTDTRPPWVSGGGETPGTGLERWIRLLLPRPTIRRVIARPSWR
ncbi:MAG: hypothetical protein R3A46_05845 [Thermomicrobiales bacterium]